MVTKEILERLGAKTCGRCGLLKKIDRIEVWEGVSTGIFCRFQLCSTCFVDADLMRIWYGPDEYMQRTFSMFMME